MSFEFTQEEVLEALEACPYTAYRISTETGLSQVSIQNYRTGKSRPSLIARRTLAKYFRLAEYAEACDAAMQEGRPQPTYSDFIKRVGYDVIKQAAKPAGYRPGHEPEQPEKPYEFTAERPATLSDSAAERDMYLQLFLPLKNELAAAHAMIMAMRETNEFLENEVIRLRQARL